MERSSPFQRSPHSWVFCDMVNGGVGIASGESLALTVVM